MVWVKNSACNGSQRGNPALPLFLVLALLLLPSAAVQAELVGLWRFDADVASQPDATTNANDATTIVGAVWSNDVERGGTMYFDGDNDYVEASDSDSLSIVGDMSIAAWVKREAGGGIKGVVGKTDGNAPASYDFYVFLNGKLRFLRGDGSTFNGPISTNNVATSQWDHVVATMEGTEVRFYVNGNEAGSGTITGVPITDKNKSLRIGNRDDLGVDFLGQLDDVAVFDEALNAAQVHDVMGGDFRAFGIFDSLSLYKTASADPVLGGQPLTYTITVANPENGTSTNVIIRDLLPDCVAMVSASSTVGTCVYTQGILECQLGNLASGAVETVTVVIDPLLSGTITNVAVLTADSPDSSFLDNTSVVETVVLPKGVYTFEHLTNGSLTGQDGWSNVTADASVVDGTGMNASKVVQGTASTFNYLERPNDTNFCFVLFDGTETNAIFQLDVQYNAAGRAGMAASSPGGVGPQFWLHANTFATIRDAGFGTQIDAPLALADQPAAGDWLQLRMVLDFTGAAGEGAGEVFLRNLTAGDTDFTSVATNADLQIASGLPTNPPSTWNGAFIYLHDVSQRLDNLIVGMADLEVSKEVQPEPGLAGSNLTYTVTVTNDGPNASEEVAIVDFLPPELTYVSAFAVTPGGTCLFTNQQVICDFGTNRLAVGGAFQVQVVTKATVDGVVTNKAVACSKKVYDPNETNNVTVVETTVIPCTDLNIVKTDSPDPVNAEQLISYTITVSNQPGCNADGVVVTDYLPPDAVFYDASSSYTWTDDEVTFSLGTLTVGSSAAITVRVVAAGSAVGGVITNVASVLSDYPDPDPTDNVATQETSVIEPFEFCLDGFKLSPSLVAAGDVVDFVLSPDGARAAFQASPKSLFQWRIYSAPLNGSGVPILLSEIPMTSGGANTPVVSPDSQWVLYHAEVNTSPYTKELYARRIDGREPSVKLSFAIGGGQVRDGLSIVSPDSQYAVYVAEHDGAGIDQVYSVPIDGSAFRTKLNDTLPSGGDVVTGFNGPQIAPDSSRVAYLADGSVNDKIELYSVAITGGPPITLSALPANDRDVFDFQISSNGERVVYRADQRANGISELYSVAITGGPPVQLNPNFSSSVDLFSSAYLIAPDGTTVLYVADYPVNNQRQLFRVPIDASTAPVALNDPLSGPGGVNNNAPEGLNTTPDSSRVVFLGTMENAATIGVYTVSMYGGGPQTKLNNPLPEFGNVIRMAIAPDGSRVVYTADENTAGRYELFSVPLDTSSPPVRISGDLVAGGGVVDFAEQYPSVLISPDSSTVIYRADQNVDEQFELFTVPIDGSAPAIRMHPPLVSGGDVRSLDSGFSKPPFLIDANSRLVAYTADQETDEKIELFVSHFDGPRVDLAFAKSDGADPSIAGLPLTYTFYITNNSICDARDVVVTDLLPPGVTPAGAVNTNAGDVASGASTSITLTVTVDSSTLGDITNSASVAAQATDTNSVNNAEDEVTTIIAQADLAVEKTDAPDPAVAGQDAITYTIAVTNLGPSDAVNVLVDDDLPAGVTPTGGVNSNLGTIAAGSVGSFQVIVSVDAGTLGAVTNEARVSSPTPDPNLLNNTNREPTTVNALADLGVDKADSADPVVAGQDSITYTISVTNFGPSDAQFIGIGDFLPAGVTPFGLFASNVPALPVGGTVQFDIDVDVNDDTLGPITNTVIVTALTPDPNPANDTNREVTVVNAVSDLGLKKSDSPDPIVDDNALTYTIVVTNFGPSLARNVTVTDFLPPGVTPGGAPVSNLGSVAVGASAQFQIQVAVDGNTVGTITNRASAASDAVDNNAANDADAAETTIADLDGDNQPDFADSDDDDDGMTDDYENRYSLDPKDENDANDDDDNDTISNLGEFVADTVPTNGESFLRVDDISINSPVVVTFPSTNTRIYSLRYASNLLENTWIEVGTNEPGLNGTTSITDTNEANLRHYRIGVQLAPSP